jgi:hypothetical protein
MQAQSAAIVAAVPQTLGRLGEEMLGEMPSARIGAQLGLEHGLAPVAEGRFRSNRFGPCGRLCQPEPGIHLFKELIDGIQCRQFELLAVAERNR